MSKQTLSTEHILRSKWVISLLALLLVVAAGTSAVFLHPHSYAAQAAGATLKVSPTSGPYTDRDDQAPINVYGYSYAANETVKVYWNYTGPNTGTLVDTVTANSKGSFTTNFLYQLAATGTYTIAGIGQTSGDVATAQFTLYPDLYERPQAGGPSSSTVFSGFAFSAGEQVNIYWNYRGPTNTGTLLATTPSDSTGSFTANATIPANVTPGTYPVAAVGQTSNLKAKYFYIVYTPTLMLAPTSGSPKTDLNVSAYGFTGSEKVQIFWGGNTTPISTATTTAFGYLLPTTVTVPGRATPGTYHVKVVGESSHITVKNTFTIVAPGITLSSVTGPVGTNINLTGQGYTPGETVHILWNYNGSGTGQHIADVTAGYSGLIQASFSVPSSATGPYNVAAVGASSGRTSEQQFTLAQGLAASPASNSAGLQTTVFGTGFQANETVNYYWDSISGTQIGQSSADGNGNASKDITIPASATPGTHSVIAMGQASGTSFTASVLVNTNWGDFGFDPAHHRQNYYENTLSPGNAGQLKLKWTATTATGLKSSPVYANGIVYIGSMDGSLNAYNATTGALQWQFSCQCIFRNFSSPLVDSANNLVFFGTDGYADQGIPSPFYALDAQTGQLKWAMILPWHSVGFPTLAFNTIYAGTSHLDHGSCALYAFDEFTGHIKWQYAADAGFWGAVGVDSAKQWVFTGIGNPVSTVVALNAFTGAAIWSTSIPQYGPDDDVGSSIAVDNGMVYTSSKNGSVYGLDENTGSIVWSSPAGPQSDGNISSEVVSNTGLLYVGSIDKSFYAFNASTGALKWKYTTGRTIMSTAAIANGVVYFASFDQKIYALNASTGALLWSYTTGGASFSSPVVVNGWLYCGSSDGKLYAFSL
jgi:outer membrane protein assembly factor BamB